MDNYLTAFEQVLKRFVLSVVGSFGALMGAYFFLGFIDKLVGLPHLIDYVLN